MSWVKSWTVLQSPLCRKEMPGLSFSVPPSSKTTISTHVAGSSGICFYIVIQHTCLSTAEVFTSFIGFWLLQNFATINHHTPFYAYTPSLATAYWEWYGHHWGYRNTQCFHGMVYKCYTPVRPIMPIMIHLSFFFHRISWQIIFHMCVCVWWAFNLVIWN